MRTVLFIVGPERCFRSRYPARQGTVIVRIRDAGNDATNLSSACDTAMRGLWGRAIEASDTTIDAVPVDWERGDGHSF